MEDCNWRKHKVFKRRNEFLVLMEIRNNPTLVSFVTRMVWENLKFRKKDFNNHLFQNNINVQANTELPHISVPIGLAKNIQDPTYQFQDNFIKYPKKW